MKKKYNIEDIFRPTSFPEHTYVDRIIADEDSYEFRLKKALRSAGRLISITGTSKSGKTVLCHKIVDSDLLIDISGAQITSKEDLWSQIAEKIRFPVEVQISSTAGKSYNEESSFGGKVGAFGVGAETHSKKTNSDLNSHSISEKATRSNKMVVDYLIKNKKILLIDDFHYINDELQMYIARILKTELFNGLRVIIISLPHRADDAIRHNPDLIGRTTFIEIEPWKKSELAEIAVKGFELLGYKVNEEEINLLATESISSPQLMQENCLNLSYIIDANKSLKVNFIQVKKAFYDTAINYNHYDNSLEKVAHGPDKGRNNRKKYTCKDGKLIDIYELVLNAIYIDPPKLILPIEEIKNRIGEILEEDVNKLSTLTISNTLMHINKIFKEVLPKLDTLEWREQKLYLLDPFLLFYLRWRNK